MCLQASASEIFRQNKRSKAIIAAKLVIADAYIASTLVENEFVNVFIKEIKVYQKK